MSLPGLLRELGADPEAVFGLAGVPVSAVANPRASIAFLTSGVSWPLAPVSELMLTAPTIRDAVTDLLRNLRMVIASRMARIVEHSVMFPANMTRTGPGIRVVTK